MNSLLYLFERTKNLYSGENYNKDLVDFINMFVKPLVQIDYVIKRDMYNEFYEETFDECPICGGDLRCSVGNIDNDGICLNIVCMDCGANVCVDIKYLYDCVFDNAAKGIAVDTTYQNLTILIHDLIKNSIEELKKEENV